MIGSSRLTISCGRPTLFRPMNVSLTTLASTISSAVERRLFAEYGAIFVTSAIPPPKIIFNDSQEVEQFQTSLSVGRALFGQHEIELQSNALDALIDAASEITRKG